MNKLYKFWDWYDDLHGKRDALRFWIFFGPTLLLLGFVPVIVHFGFGFDIQLAQLPGLLILFTLAMTKRFRPRRK